MFSTVGYVIVELSNYKHQIIHSATVGVGTKQKVALRQVLGEVQTFSRAYLLGKPPPSESSQEAGEPA
jgi:hypothetical protein